MNEPPTVSPVGGNTLSIPEAEEALRQALEIIQSVGTTGINYKDKEADAWLRKYFPSYAD